MFEQPLAFQSCEDAEPFIDSARGQSTDRIDRFESLPKLTSVEWKSVAVALKDSEGGGSPPPAEGSLRGFISRIVQTLTGITPLQPLANPRLEALRLFVIETRRSRRLPVHRVDELRQLGFNDRQIDALGMLLLTGDW